MKNGDSIQTNLAYQKQLLNALNKIVLMRTELIKSSVILIDDGKEREWTNFDLQLKYFKKNIEKSNDPNLKTIFEILRVTEQPIRKLESNLELKNNFVQILSEQAIESPAEK